MQRDMDLIRKILLDYEERPEYQLSKRPVIVGYTDDQVKYHCYLLMDAGLARGSDVHGTELISPKADINWLTWKGHEFLDAARDPATWEKAEATLKSAGKDLRSVTVGVLQRLLTQIISRSLGL